MAYISSTADRFRSRAKSEAFPQATYLEWEADPGLMPAESAPAADNKFYDDEDITTEEELSRQYRLEDVEFNTSQSDGQVCTSRNKGYRVFIKRIPKSDSEDFENTLREIKIRCMINDITIASQIHSLELDDVLWSVVEHRPARSLGQIVRSQGPFPDGLVKTFLNQLFGGVASLFSAGFAHLRICDETVYMDDLSQFTIGDFQYVREYGKARDGDLYAPISDKFAADIYVAPEVFANNKYNARKAVIWSCGVLLYFVTTAQTEKLSNLDHPSFEGAAEMSRPRSMSTSRRFSQSVSSPRIILYPNRFSAPNYARAIIPKMLIQEPMRRAELIEVASRVPKDFSKKMTRPLMELAWLDYKEHVGPYAGLHMPDDESGSSASSIFSAASNMSNPFKSLLGRGNSRRQSAPAYAGYL